jgi:hypothetical protein
MQLFMLVSHSLQVGATMAKKVKKSARREWTATDVHKLKGLAKKRVGVNKIARALNRSVGATALKAHMLGVSLDTRA